MKPTAWCRAVVAMCLAACLAALLAGCSKGAATFPGLDAAARAHLAALSSGWGRGDPAAAASLSAGPVAARDTALAQAYAAQEGSGDATDYAFDILSVNAHPLDGGGSDFIAYEQVRFDSSGAISNLVELYHRASPLMPWKAYDGAYFADNIVLPALKLDSHGDGHLLSPSQAASANAAPATVAARYANAVGAVSGSLPAGSFSAGEFTSGEVNNTNAFVSEYSGHGVASIQWVPQPGGEAVALVGGVLSFGELQQTEAIYNNAGATNYFDTQDQKRIAFGGLLAPGNYHTLTLVSSATIAVVVTPTGLPNVVARDVEVISAQGQLVSNP